jgi:2-C-methyl-D-erythritol 2,4-cyclodiphosphate synthase
MSGIRIGQGFDVHRFAAAEDHRPLILMGCEIPHDRGLAGHSDADVMVHALMDALLGAAALGDIGTHFPDTALEYKGADSLVLLEKVKALLKEKNYKVINVDGTIIAQEPKMKPHIPEMREKLAAILKIAVEDINIKATTEEGLGFTGAKEGISAQVIVMIDKRF